MAVYASGFLLWYSATTLGLAPMLDGREQLELATHIAADRLPFEAYYRAPLYASLLAWLIKAGVTVQLPFAARMVNGTLHLLSTALVWLIAMRVWRKPAAAALAALLFGMNPVVLHFAADPLDLTLSISLMLGGILATLRALQATPVARIDLACAAGLLACAMLARPQMLLLLPALLLCVLVQTERVRLLPWALLPMLLVGALMGAANLQVGGEFRVLPWQGAYNLWAANGPQANGRYFVQRERLAVYAEGGNPARVESERLYRRENPAAADDYASQTRYWQRRTLTVLVADPLPWLRLVASKAWYLLNNFEQYDIKTYHFHKTLSPWLRWNPLCWAMLLAAACAALAAQPQQRAARVVALFAMCYGGGLLLSYVSARFRLPLVPLAAILGGGVVTIESWARRARGAAVAILVLGIAWQPLPAGEADRTLVEDYLLSARAAESLGFTAEAISNARQALVRAPADEAARELLCVAAFNAWLRAAHYKRAGPTQDCRDAADYSPVAKRALGILAWREGRAAEATRLWRELVAARGAEHDAALAALVMIKEARAELAALDGRQTGRWASELLLALAIQGDASARQAVAARLSAVDIQIQSAALMQLFAPPSAK